MRYFYFFICSLMVQLYAGEWSSIVPLGTSTIFPSNLGATINDSGTAIVSWGETNIDGGLVGGMFASVYNGSTWGSATQLSTELLAGLPQVTIINSGIAICVWTDENLGGSSTRRIYSSNYDGSTWSAKAELGDSGVVAFDPSLGYSENGTAIAAWQRLNNAVYGRIYNGTSWSASDIAISEVGEDVNDPEISVNDSGNGLTVWENSTNDVMQASVFNGTSWEAYTTFSSGGTNVAKPFVSINNSNKGLAVWYADEGIKASFYNGTSWEAVVSLTTDNAKNPRVVYNNNGVGLAIWQNTDDSSIEVATFSSGSWSSPTVISSGIGTPTLPQLQFLDGGGSLATWFEASAVYYSENTGTGWSIPVKISGASTVAPPPAVPAASLLVLNPQGKGATAWRDNADGTIYASNFTGSFPSPSNDTPPTNTSISFQDNQITLYFSDPTSEVVSYNVYFNTTSNLVYEVAATGTNQKLTIPTPFYKDPVEVIIRSVNSSGVESESIVFATLPYKNS